MIILTDHVLICNGFFPWKLSGVLQRNPCSTEIMIFKICGKVVMLIEYEKIKIMPISIDIRGFSGFNL
jgi:hypothetical protein